VKSLTLLAAVLLTAATAVPGPPEGAMTDDLVRYVEARVEEFDDISTDRRELLGQLGSWVSNRSRAGGPTDLVFICTHNSRRSHMAQIWAQVAAAWYGVDGVTTYSGGTEATAFNPRAVAALARAGLEIEVVEPGDNPVYEVRYAESTPPIRAFSKVYSDPPNPTSDFCAVMTCSDADEACPLVLGADERITITYVDPKVSDGSDREATTYDERCAEIGREMLYAMSRVAGR
jgi:hypothetical protein